MAAMAAPTASSGARLSVGVGIGTGPAFDGNIQPSDGFIWTVIGDTVNLAARLQGHDARARRGGGHRRHHLSPRRPGDVRGVRAPCGSGHSRPLAARDRACLAAVTVRITPGSPTPSTPATCRRTHTAAAHLGRPSACFVRPAAGARPRLPWRPWGAKVNHRNGEQRLSPTLARLRWRGGVLWFGQLARRGAKCDDFDRFSGRSEASRTGKRRGRDSNPRWSVSPTHA